MSAPYPREPHAFHGRVELWPVESAALRGNPLGDPHVRELPVYLPPGHERPGARFPLILVLSGFTGRGQSHLETHPWRLGVVPRYDRLVARGEAPPAILALPDCLTRLGGSQYVNSSATGRYEDHVADELVPLAERELPVLPGRRGVVGKSSGGFGALHLAMRRPGLFQAVASISGDCAFEYSLAPDLLACLRGLVSHGGDPARFLAEFERNPTFEGDNLAVLNVLAMAACYSPEPGSALGFALPMDLQTGARIEGVWRRWLELDPLEACARHRAALAGLELLHLECGLRDEHHLQWGLRLLVRRLRELEVPHVHEEHAGSHRGTDERMLAAIARVAGVLGGGAR